MDFNLSETAKEKRKQVQSFINEHINPMEKYHEISNLDIKLVSETCVKWLNVCVILRVGMRGWYSAACGIRMRNALHACGYQAD